MLVDSKQKELQPQEIVMKDAQQPNSQYSPDQALAAVLAESRLPSAILMQEGNTLFVIHKCPDRIALARIINADTEQNYLENSMLCFKAMYAAGIDTVVFDLKNKDDIRVFKYMESHRDKINKDKDGEPTVGYVMNPKGDGYRVTAVIGPRREGQM